MPRYAVGLPNVGPFADARTLVELAVAAEERGWDGVFLWDHLLYHDDWPVVNTVVVASAVAALTSRIRLGVLVTALPRRRVQTVARETAALDTLSGGRLVFGAGIGSMDAEYAAFGEDPDLRARGRRLDDSLAQLAALWSGEVVTTPAGHPVRMLPAPVQRPRVPVWCAGRWPNRPGFRRSARWDGFVATFTNAGQGVPVPVEDFADVVGFVGAERGSLDGFDVVLEGATTPQDAPDVIAPYAAAGLTWWIEAMGWWRGGVAAARERILAGPPR
ncbi:LLM class flavin-dependent oxidoreductase [Micromonospora krabiensis]|uniref:Flavin-dependent oxidoreductase, luciferase family (Includes alkanesulfonate monooxygenase SsuD and methylene tetrahydromethanopterin reductase) n=1 Tax=Micromonospora krabiensis TaxID=307121 RepID=A0A1C3NCK4_9ACTN|nr:LLM class flavin-dependent oxidoreductase [Micromonospora krabiensis]SBV30324.1 Flavin-dependent oxidoreductase, luciferase family (includes alkanesulfonate monooxygenase SsuD and methylene tetrahydromethanopterin reductase) [Micromonospora krabiensis]